MFKAWSGCWAENWIVSFFTSCFDDACWNWINENLGQLAILKALRKAFDKGFLQCFIKLIK